MVPTEVGNKMNAANSDYTRNRRQLLGFIDAVHTRLEPLLHSYGFAIVDSSPEVVRFNSPSVNLAIIHQPLSYELDLVVSRKDQPGERFALQDMVGAALGKDDEDRVFFQASTTERVAQCVSAIAQLLQRYGDGMLRGDAETFRRMAEVSKYRSHKLTKEVVNEPIRKAAELAWKNQDYTEVKNRYESIYGELTEIEAKRLDYATRHLNGRGSDKGAL